MRAADVSKYAYGYELLARLRALQVSSRESDVKYRVKEFGEALRYGNYAVVAACLTHLMSRHPQDPQAALMKVIAQWREFERSAATKVKNKAYRLGKRLDGVNYYKGNTVNDDLHAFRFEIG